MYILTNDFTAAGVRISGSGRVTWPESYESYGAKYAATARAIRDWVATGKKAGALPPLFDPNAMVSWWKAHRRNKVPAGILTASQFEQEAGPAPKIELPVAAVTRSKDDDEQKRNSEGLYDGVDDALRQARDEVRLAHSSLETARNTIDENGRKDNGLIEACRKEYNAASDNLRKWEKDFIGIQEKRGLFVRKSAMGEEVGAIAVGLSRAFLNSMLKLLAENAPAMSQKEQRAAAIEARDRCFDILREGDFSLDVSFETSPPQ